MFFCLWSDGSIHRPTVFSSDNCLLTSIKCCSWNTGKICRRKYEMAEISVCGDSKPLTVPSVLSISFVGWADTWTKITPQYLKQKVSWLFGGSKYYNSMKRIIYQFFAPLGTYIRTTNMQNKNYFIQHAIRTTGNLKYSSICKFHRKLRTNFQFQFPVMIMLWWGQLNSPLYKLQTTGKPGKR